MATKSELSALTEGYVTTAQGCVTALTATLVIIAALPALMLSAVGARAAPAPVLAAQPPAAAPALETLQRQLRRLWASAHHRAAGKDSMAAVQLLTIHTCMRGKKAGS